MRAHAQQIGSRAANSMWRNQSFLALGAAAGAELAASAFPLLAVLAVSGFVDSVLLSVAGFFSALSPDRVPSAPAPLLFGA